MAVHLRLYRGVVDHWPARASEWFMAGLLITWGAIVLKPSNLFATNPVFYEMTRIASEVTWGWVAVIIGILRLSALVVNGTFANSWYGKYSPHVRSLMSALSMFILLFVSIGLWKAGNDTTGLAVYPWLAALDFWNVVRASTDAGYMDTSRKNGIP